MGVGGKRRCITGSKITRIPLAGEAQSHICCLRFPQMCGMVVAYEGIVVLDSLTWTDADILVRVAGINLSPSCVPLHRSASESGYVSRQLVHLQLSEDFFWTGDGGAPVTVRLKSL